MVCKDVIMNYVIEYEDGKTENANKDEVKRLLAPLKANDGIVTRFDGEDPTLWIIEHRCVQHATSETTWIYAIRQLREAKIGLGYVKSSRKEYVPINDFTPVKLLKGANSRYNLDEDKFW